LLIKEKTEYTEDLIQEGHIYGLRDRLEYLRKEIIRLFRQGMDAQANQWMIEYTGESLDCISRGSQVYDPIIFGKVISELLLAQQNRDSVRVADLMEYELPVHGLVPDTIQITEVYARAEFSPSGSVISCDLLVIPKGGSGKYEYQYFTGNEPDNMNLIKEYGEGNTCHFEFNTDQEHICIRVWVRCIADHERFNPEASVIIRADNSEI